MNNNLSALRHPIALLLATLITTALFTLLQNLTATSFQMVSTKAIGKIEWQPTHTDTPIETKHQPKPELVHPPLINIEIKDPGDHKINPTIIPVERIIPKASGGDRQALALGSDRDVVPMVRVSPDYPQRAAARNIEGWVQVRFNITATGSVSDVVVVASEPQGYFEKAAVDAVARWRYNPKVEGAVTVERRGMETRLRFELPPQ